MVSSLLTQPSLLCLTAFLATPWPADAGKIWTPSHPVCYCYCNDVDTDAAGEYFDYSVDELGLQDIKAADKLVDRIVRKELAVK